MHIRRASNALPRRLAWLALAPVAALAAAGVLLAGLAQAGAAHAHAPVAAPAAPNASLVVTNTNNLGAGSLRRAINEANLLYTGTHDIITFDLSGCPCVITLASALPVIEEALTLIGPGADQLAVDGAGSYRVFETEDGVPLSLSGLTIQHGHSSSGGGAINASGLLTLTHVNVLSNTADGQGGAVRSGGNAVTDITIIGGVFQGNAANNDGGAIGGSDSAVTISGTAFISNTATGWGGAIYAEGVFATGAHFERNVSAGHGGAAWAFNLAFTQAVFISNTATSNGYGGGFFAETEGHSLGGWFEANTASQGGGLFGYSLVLTDNVVISNTAQTYGGGAYGVEASASGGQFVGNVSHGDGGGLVGSYLVVSGTTFLSNSAAFNAGALNVEGGSTLHRVRLEGNQAGEQGGGLYANAPLTLTDSIVTGNLAAQGGGLYFYNGRAENLLFAGNTATGTQAGSAIHISGAGSTRLAHLTVDGPAAPGGRAIVLGNGEAHITNTIVAGYGVAFEQQAGTLTEDYNLFFNVATPTSGTVSSGGSSLTGDPAFADAAGGNYHLGPGSDALNAGANAGTAADYDGDPRPLGPGYDIGFDEASFITGLAAMHAPEPAEVGQSVTFTATAAEGAGVTYTWDFDDGSPQQAGSVVTHTFAAAGEYHVTVTASNPSGSAQAATEVSVVLPAQRLYLPLVVR